MDRQQVITQGRAVQDLVKMEGWAYLKLRIDKEIASTVEELRDIRLEGKTLELIGAEFVEKQKLIDGLSRTQEIINEMAEEMDQALTE